MMKTMKKLASIVLALVMALALAAPAFADDTQTGSITIENANETATYTAYRIFDLTYSTTGEGENVKTLVAYTMKDGSQFETLVRDYTQKDGCAFTLTPSIGDASVYVVSFPTNPDGTSKLNGTEFAAYLRDAVRAEGADYTGTVLTTTTIVEGEGETQTKTTTATATDLPLGYYFVDSNAGTLCVLDNTTPDATAQEKNEVPTVEKKQSVSDDDNVKIGDDIDYTITIAVKKGAETYVLHDTMGAGLKLKEEEGKDTFTVKVDGADVDKANYTVATPGTKGETFTITFTDAYLATIPDKNIVVTYTATILDTAAIPDGATIKSNTDNTATVTYGEDGKTTPSDTDVKLYEFDLVKTDGEGKLLDGAVFKLYDAKYVTESEDKDGKKVYTLDERAEAITVSEVDGGYKVSGTSENTDIVVTGGKVTVAGLNGTYYLKETKAPAGYNLLTTLKPITVTGNNHYALNETTGEYEGGEQVVNQSGSVLPSTGGIGTTIFYVGGGILVVGAVILLITKKRMGSAD